MNFLRLILVSLLGYLIYKMVKPLFIGSGRQSAKQTTDPTRENIQKKYADKIEDADFEEIDE